MFLYNLLISLALPLLVLRLWRHGGADLKLRLARGRVPRPQGRVLWIHGASNGELASARTVVEAALAFDPGLVVVVSANTVTGRDLVRGWMMPRVLATLAPFDTLGATGRFLDQWRPEALIVIENELWPNRLDLCARRAIPVAVLGARLSARSARGWGRFPGLARQVLGAIRWLSAQDDASRDRFRALGLAEDRLGPVVTLKSAPAQAAGRSPLPWPRAAVLLAASTHDGEEAIVLDALLAARPRRPDLRLILAPRHPRRAVEIAGLVAARGLRAAQRSRGETPDAATEVYLADSMGEMALWYAAAGMTLVGGSLVDHGGHTPYEPVAAGSAVLHGPHVANSAPAYAALDAAGAAVTVADAAQLAAAVLRLADTGTQTAFAARASAALPAANPGPAIAAALDKVLKGNVDAV